MPYLSIITKEHSVKELGILVAPTATEHGLGDFHFQNVYSVFNYGKMLMPEGMEIDNSPLALMAAFNFELLAKRGIPSHYLGLVDAEGYGLSFEDAKREICLPSALRVRLVNKLPLRTEHGYDYSIFKNPPAMNYMLPLEIIFRNELLPESSVWKRVDAGEASLAEDFNLPKTFKKGDALPFPILDFSTKYEASDRYVTHEEARELAGLSIEQFELLKLTAHDINKILTDYAESLGFRHPDGKVEFAWMGSREVLVDVAGTWHEDRYEYKGQKISKQILRDAHMKLQPDWVKRCLGIQDAYNRGRITVEDWKQLVPIPEPLPNGVIEHYNNLMQAASNHYLQHTFYPQASSLEESIKEFQAFWVSEVAA